jgi:hypothetical protein
VHDFPFAGHDGQDLVVVLRSRGRLSKQSSVPEVDWLIILCIYSQRCTT